AILQEAGVPCGPINTVDKVLQEPQLQAREMCISVSDRHGNTIQTANNPVRLSAAGERPKTARSPLLDEHREALIQEFMTSNGHAKLSQIRQLAATDSGNVDLSFVKMAMQQ
ncbi:MAG: CoA transferase, partial [Acetobacteraceae bacterium]|nr:CoA transferase [Acetobacteraceae bacterium]